MDTIVYSNKGVEVGKVSLPSFFDTEVSSVVLHEATVAYLNNQRSGTHKAKSRGEIAFSGAKPWKQKGTGRARSGQRNSPLWRKGGVIFGPKPKDYYCRFPKQKRQLSLYMAFAAQQQNGNIIFVDSLKIDELKTKKVADIIKNLKLNNERILFAIVPDKVFQFAAKNLRNVAVENIKNVNAYQILWADKIITTSDAVRSIGY